MDNSNYVVPGQQVQQPPDPPAAAPDANFYFEQQIPGAPAYPSQPTQAIQQFNKEAAQWHARESEKKYASMERLISMNGQVAQGQRLDGFQIALILAREDHRWKKEHFQQMKAAAADERFKKLCGDVAVGVARDILKKIFR